MARPDIEAALARAKETEQAERARREGDAERPTYSRIMYYEQCRTDLPPIARYALELEGEVERWHRRRVSPLKCGCRTCTAVRAREGAAP